MRGGFRDAEDALCLVGGGGGRGTRMLPDESSLRNDFNASSLLVFLYFSFTVAAHTVFLAYR